MSNIDLVIGELKKCGYSDEEILSILPDMIYEMMNAKTRRATDKDLPITPINPQQPKTKKK